VGILGNVEDRHSVLLQNIVKGPRESFQGLLRKRSQERIADMGVNQSARDTQVLFRLAHNPVEDEMQRLDAALLALAPEQADDHRPHVDVLTGCKDGLPRDALEQYLRQVWLSAGARTLAAALGL